MILTKPWLWLPSALAHDLSPYFLGLYSKFKKYESPSWHSFTWRGLEFKNPLGIAGGVDKNGDQVRGWWSLGAGFVEVGTVTPAPQKGNSGRVMSRSLSHQALWNRMGFPSRGADYVREQMESLLEPHFTPIFVNIGKNAQTPLDRAHEDYIFNLRRLGPYADAFVINLSSPNTEGLRKLLEPQALRGFLQTVIQVNTEEFARPLLLKLSPDMDEEQMAQVLELSLELGLDGWILTNTSTALRQGLSFPREGGVSGGPLAPLARERLIFATKILGPRRNGRLLISCGGVLSAEDVFDRLELGAQLVQVYSALVFQGPSFFRQVAQKALESTLREKS